MNANLERREAEIDVLLEINRRLRSHFELRGLLRDVLNYTRNLLESEASSIVLLDEGADELFFYVTDDTGTGLDEIRLKRGQGVVGQVVENSRTRVVEDARKDPDFFDGVDRVTGFETRNLICVPLRMENRTVGALEVLNRREGFGEDEIRLLEIISSQAVMAIEYVKATENRLEQERMALLGNMSASIVHDLRNSMSVIQGYADLIGLKAPEHLDLVSVITREVSKLSVFCHELLDFARGSEVQLQLAPVSLQRLVLEAVEGVERRFQRHGCQLDVDSGSQNVTVELDAVRMGRVLMNLLSNALESMKDEPGTARVQVGSCGQSPTLRIEDQGCGMSSETKARLFEPFYTSGKVSGTGLGMAIVKNILDSHGFGIEVVSTPGQGTVFTLKLGKDNAGN